MISPSMDAEARLMAQPSPDQPTLDDAPIAHAHGQPQTVAAERIFLLLMINIAGLQNAPIARIA